MIKVPLGTFTFGASFPGSVFHHARLRVASKPPSGLGRLLSAGGAAALAMGGAAAMAALAGSGNRKEHGKAAPEERVGLLRETERSTDKLEADEASQPHENTATKLETGAAHLVGKAAEEVHALWTGPDNLTLSIRQASRSADGFLDCHDILAGSGAANWQDYLGYMRQILRMNLEHLQEMIHCRSPESLITRHAELTVKQVDLALQTGMRMADRSARAASQTAHKMIGGKGRFNGS